MYQFQKGVGETGVSPWRKQGGAEADRQNRGVLGSGVSGAGRRVPRQIGILKLRGYGNKIKQQET